MTPNGGRAQVTRQIVIWPGLVCDRCCGVLLGCGLCFRVIGLVGDGSSPPVKPSGVFRLPSQRLHPLFLPFAGRLVVVLLWFRVRLGSEWFSFIVLLRVFGPYIDGGVCGVTSGNGGLGVCEGRDHMGNRLGEGTGVGAHGWFWFYICFYVEPVGDVCLATGRALGCLMVLFLAGRAGMTRSLIMSLTVDLVSP